MAADYEKTKELFSKLNNHLLGTTTNDLKATRQKRTYEAARRCALNKKTNLTSTKFQKAATLLLHGKTTNDFDYSGVL